MKRRRKGRENTEKEDRRGKIGESHKIKFSQEVHLSLIRDCKKPITNENE